MALLHLSGKITLLRVNEVGDTFGPANDNIKAEVIVRLDTHPPNGVSGFNLLTDENQPVRQGMLDLLRDAFNYGWRANIDHMVDPPKTKGQIIRVWITKDPPPAGLPVDVGPVIKG
jgi:hypothetical protein